MLVMVCKRENSFGLSTNRLPIMSIEQYHFLIFLYVKGRGLTRDCGATH